MQEYYRIIGRSQHMHENLETIIRKGFYSWVRNLNICIPFILNFFVDLILLVLFLVLLSILLLASNTGNVVNTASLSQKEILSTLLEGFTENIIVSILLILLFFLIGMFIQSFFTAGAIAMAKKASETGDAPLSDMFISGSKNAFRFFLTTLLITLLELGGIIFIVPGVLIVGDISTLIENPIAQMQGTEIITIGLTLLGIYIVAISIVLSPTLYALVIDGLGTFEALSTGFNFFMKNKMDVFLIWIIFTVLSSINILVSEYADPGSILVSWFTSLLPIVIIQPLKTVIWTRIYVSKEGQKLYDPSYLLSYSDKGKEALK